jgi:hypothetical protein
MKIDGACHCGRISYEAEVNPDLVVICHCTDCQTNSGAPYRANVPVLLENFRLKGEPKTYVKTGGSGRKVRLSFCGDCGSALFSSKVEGASYNSLRLGAIRQRAQLVPKAQYFCRSAMAWAFDLSQIPRSADGTQIRAEG